MLRCRTCRTEGDLGGNIAARGTSAFILPSALILFVGCGAGDAPPPVAVTESPLFVEVTSELLPVGDDGAWPDGTYFLPEIMGGGLGLVDYDNDDDLDLLQIRFPPPGQPQAPAPNRLYRQEPDGTFADVTAESGLGDPGYGQGVATGDADGDGDPDVYVTNYGADAFYLNNGDGTFTDASEPAGFAGDGWSSSAAFVDYDRDGDLDLYVVRYLELDPELQCEGVSLAREYCAPQEFPGAVDSLYRNNGDGSFTDVAVEAGIATPGKGLGVLCADLTGDGWVDIYVANDTEVNFLWVNRGDGTFVDEAILRGVGFNVHGTAEASMGLTLGDANRDGRLDLFMTHLQYESNTLYTATEHGVFSDDSDSSGLAMIDRPFTGFGCGFFDYDNDGDPDLAVANGGISRGRVYPGSIGTFWNHHAEPNLLLENDGTGRFRNVSDRAGAFGGRVEVSRGLAFGDIDRDGDVDLVVGNLGGPPRIFRNDAPAPGAHWLAARVLVGERDAIGAEVTLVAGGTRYAGLALAGYSYASSNDAKVHFGLGAVDRVDAIEVVWPDGSRERFPSSDVDRVVTLRKGEGETL